MTEIETYLLNKIEVRERLAKKMKRFHTITGIFDIALTTSTFFTGGIYSIADIISQEMQDGDISYIEFHRVSQEVKNIANLRLILGIKPRPR